MVSQSRRSAGKKQFILSLKELLGALSFAYCGLLSLMLLCVLWLEGYCLNAMTWSLLLCAVSFTQGSMPVGGVDENERSEV